MVEAIVEAGCRVLADKGWEGFRMYRVAEVAGVSPGSLYQYFPNKGALVTEIIERESARELAFVLENLTTASADDPCSALDRVVRLLLAYQRERGPVMRQAMAAVPQLGRHPALVARAAALAAFLRAQLEPQTTVRAVDPTVATFVLGNAIHSITHDGVFPRLDDMDDEKLACEIGRLVRGYLSVTPCP